MRPSRPAQHFWRCIHHPSKCPSVIHTSKTSSVSSHNQPHHRRTFATSIILLRKSRSPFKSLSRDDVSRLSKSSDRSFKSYSNEDVKDLERNYTPNQIRAITLAEEAIPDRDFVTKAQPRNDGFLLENEQFDDFSRVVPLIDKRYEALYDNHPEYENYKSITEMVNKNRPPDPKEIIQELGSALLGDSEAEQHPNAPATRYAQGKNPDPRLELLWEMELEELGDGLERIDYSGIEHHVSLEWSNLNDRGNRPYNLQEDHILSAWSSKLEDNPQGAKHDMKPDATQNIGGFEPRDPPEGLFELLGSKDVWHPNQSKEHELRPDESESSSNIVLEIDEKFMASSEGPFALFNAHAFHAHDEQVNGGVVGSLTDLDGENGQNETGAEEWSVDGSLKGEFEDNEIGAVDALDIALKRPLPFSNSFLRANSHDLKDTFAGNYAADLEAHDKDTKLAHRFLRSSVDDVVVWHHGELKKVVDIISLEDAFPKTSELVFKTAREFLDEFEEEDETTDPATVLRLQKVLDRLDPKKKPNVAPDMPSLREPGVRWISATEDNEDAENAIPGDEDKALAFARLSKQTGLSVGDLVKIQTKVLVVNSVSNQTRMGKVHSLYVLAVAGNEDGLVGIGEGKAIDLPDAARQAQVNAIRSMNPIRRYENRTIYGESKSKVAGTVVELSARPPGFGLRVNHLVFEIARAAGLQDLSGRTPRSRNKMNVCKATVQALHDQPDPEEIAKARGKKLIDVRKVYYSGII